MMKSFYFLFPSFFISLLMTVYLVPHLILVAKKLGIMDCPDGNLKAHKQPTPYLGGIALYLGFIISLALIYPFENTMFLFLVGSTLLLFIGFIDDIVAMAPYQKFFGQIIATICFLKAGFYLKENFLFYTSNIVISFFWILTIINAFNLIDVMDGLATTTAVMATLSFLASSFLFCKIEIAILLSAFLGALIGFLKYNFPPAKIYLGDAGSLFIGGFLATVPFMLPWSYYNSFGYIAPFIILLIPLLETGTLILVRTYKKIPFYRGSPDHFSIYLQQNGWGKQSILIYVALFSLALFFISILFMLNVISIISLLTMLFILILVWYALLIIKIS